MTTLPQNNAVMRYSRVRVLLGQRGTFRRVLGDFNANGGEVQIRHVETHLLSTVYYGLLISAPPKILEPCVTRLEELFETA